jgi:hypothetical protein
MLRDYSKNDEISNQNKIREIKKKYEMLANKSYSNKDNEAILKNKNDFQD